MIRTMLSEAMWGRLAPLLPPQKPRTGRPSLDHRRFLEAIPWLARTGAPWRDLPAELMNWRTAWRLQRWTEAGIWSRVVAALADQIDAEPVWSSPQGGGTALRLETHRRS